jgi:uncharacterized protein (TIGR02453 family)
MLTLPLAFIAELTQNNHKEWMESHKKEYLAAKDKVVEFLEIILTELQAVDVTLAGTEVKKSIFRINRDIRFSKDKSPYKTNFGAYFSPTGKNTFYAGYYIHIEPNDKSMVGGGLYMPESPLLAKARQEIDYNIEEFKEIVESPAFVNTFGELQGEKVKTVPKGYDKTHPEIELLKMKSFFASKTFSDSEMKQPDIAKKIANACKILTPLNHFFNRAIDN